jgi:hypothetical protein
VCDNFIGGAGWPPIPRKGKEYTMIEELEREYTLLKDKVRVLQEYL